MLRHALAAALVLLCVPALAQDLKTVEPGKLTWGSSPTFKPFEFMRDGKAQGFDVDLMEELGKRVNLTSTMMGMEFKGVIPALLGNRIDAGVSGPDGRAHAGRRLHPLCHRRQSDRGAEGQSEEDLGPRRPVWGQGGGTRQYGVRGVDEGPQ